MAKGPRILIIESRFYADIADELMRGAVDSLDHAGASHERVAVPGAFEIPAALGMALQARGHDGYIALGCVIRGETSHYDHICDTCAQGLRELSVGYRVALGFGVLTCENREQAWARAAVAKGNKGRDAAQACLTMIAVKARLRGEAP